MATSEFRHYDGCKHNDPLNCSACALTLTTQSEPNYAGWPLAYMENNRVVPEKWRDAFRREMTQTRNIAYANNIKRHVAIYGVRFSGASVFLITNWTHV